MKSPLQIAKELQELLIFSDGRFGTRYENQNPANTRLHDFLTRTILKILAEAVVKLTEENEELKKVVDQRPWDEKWNVQSIGEE